MSLSATTGTPKRKFLFAIIAAAVVLMAISVLVFRQSTVRTQMAAGSETTATKAGAPVQVPTVKAITRQVSAFIQATGSLVGQETSDVASQASGQIIETPVNVGAFVRKGNVIARLDDREARIRLQRAQAAERQAAASVAQARARLGVGQDGRFDPNSTPEVQAARHAYERADAQARLAETNAQRYASLVETGDVARSVYDQYRTQAETARAEANAAKEQWEVAINASRSGDVGIEISEAALTAARAESALAQKAVNDATVEAPISGYVSDRPIAVGEYVNSNTKIATIIATNPIKVNLRLPESEAGHIRVGLPVTLTVAAYPEQEFRGKVTATNPAIDPASRALMVEAQIENAANLLRPGMFVTAQVLLPNHANGIFLPRAAILTDSATNSSVVFVIEGDIARVRVVALGSQADGLLEIVSGVSAGEEVAAGNLQELFDGTRIIRK